MRQEVFMLPTNIKLVLKVIYFLYIFLNNLILATTMTSIPNAEEVLNAFGEKGWELRGYARIKPTYQDLISRVPIAKRLLLFGQVYAITPKIRDSENAPAVMDRLDYLRREGLGSRLYFADEEFHTGIMLLDPVVVLFVSTTPDTVKPIGVQYARLERTIRENFGPNLITHKNI